MLPLDPHGPAVPGRFVADVFGLRNPEQAKLAARLAPALERISPSLAPRAKEHPYLEEIERGIVSFPQFIKGFETSKNEAEKVALVDAIAEVIQSEHATLEAVRFLRRVLATSKSEAMATVTARALALARDPDFLEQQRNFLASTNMVDVRLAAFLLGYGKYQPAVPVLLDNLRFDRAAALDAVIWALGEIGDDAAVPQLHAFLERFIAAKEVVRALGRIGARTSVMRVLPLLLEGTEDQRKVAAEALAGIAHRQNGGLGDPALIRSVREVLEKVAERDPSLEVRFWAMVTFGLLGGHLPANRMLAALGGQLSAEEVDAMGGLLTARATPKTKTKRR